MLTESGLLRSLRVDCFAQVLIPFLATVPFVLLMGLCGPYGYMAHNTWGTGVRFSRIVKAREECEKLWQKHLGKTPESNGISAMQLKQIFENSGLKVATGTSQGIMNKLNVLSSDPYEKLVNKMGNQEDDVTTSSKATPRVQFDDFVQWWATESENYSDYQRKQALKTVTGKRTINPVAGMESEDGALSKE